MRSSISMSKSLLALIAGMSAVSGGLPPSRAFERVFRMPSPRRSRHYPTMVVSDPAVIAAHNRAVTTRQVLRARARASA